MHLTLLKSTTSRLQKKIGEQEQLQQKFDELKAEVKELRKLKYAADRKAKGPGLGELSGWLMES